MSDIRARLSRMDPWFVALAPLALASGCGEDLGPCDQEAARQLVYDEAGHVATKGQALLHDSCGQGAFCHSAGAEGKARRGVPTGFDLDMLPRPLSIGRVLERREEIWEQVVRGEMPPEGYRVGDGDWRFDVARRSQPMPTLATTAGKGALRNWLACGAPVVVDSTVPSWATPGDDSTDPREAAWSDLHGALQRGCTGGACHDDSGRDGSSLPFEADACSVYRWLLYNRDRCGKPFVVGGEPGDSALLDKLENAAPACGAPMAPLSPLAAQLVPEVRAWVEAGAFAPQCGEWSDLAPRTNQGDAGVVAVRWDEVYDQVIAGGCVSGCHDASSASASGGLDLSDRCGSLSELLAEQGACGERRVVPGDAESLLLRKLRGGAQTCGTAMPPPAGGLSSARVELVRKWVLGLQTDTPSCE